MSRSQHQSYYLVEGLCRKCGKVVSFQKTVLAASAKKAKLKCKGWNKTALKIKSN